MKDEPHLQVYVVQLRQVCAHDLVTVHKDHAGHIQREQHIQEEDLVGPDHALLVGLLVQPVRPLVGHKLVVKAVLQQM